MVKSTVTLSLEKKAIICKIVSVCLSILPVLIFTIKAFIEGTPTKKLCMGMLVVLALILTIINILFKYSIRSTIWILMIGIYICIKNIVPLLIIIAICTILDEFLVAPLAKKFASEYKINKEIDKRES